MCYNQIMPKVLNYRVIVEQDEDDVYVASVPSVQGCYTEGNTYEEAVKNIEDALKLHLKAKESKSKTFDDTSTEFIGIKNITIPYGQIAYS